MHPALACCRKCATPTPSLCCKIVKLWPVAPESHEPVCLCVCVCAPATPPDRTYTYTVRAEDPGSKANTAFLPQPDTNNTNNQATANVTVRATCAYPNGINGAPAPNCPTGTVLVGTNATAINSISDFNSICCVSVRVWRVWCTTTALRCCCWGGECGVALPLTHACLRVCRHQLLPAPCRRCMMPPSQRASAAPQPSSTAPSRTPSFCESGRAGRGPVHDGMRACRVCHAQGPAHLLMHCTRERCTKSRRL